LGILFGSEFLKLTTIYRKSSNSSEMADEGFKCSPVFKMLDSILQEQGPELVKKVNGIYCFKVTLIRSLAWTDIIYVICMIQSFWLICRLKMAREVKLHLGLWM